MSADGANFQSHNQDDEDDEDDENFFEDDAIPDDF